MRLPMWMRSRKQMLWAIKELSRINDVMRGAIAVARVDNIEQIRDEILGIAKVNPVILPGSDIGRGIIRTAHWIGEMLAYQFGCVLDEMPADNFLTIDFFDPVKKTTYEVTIRRAEGKTPAMRIAELEKEVEQLREQRPFNAII